MNTVIILKPELINDPLAIGYAAMTDAQVATSLNDKIYTKKIPISSHDIQKYLALSNLLLVIEASTLPSAISTNRMLELFDIFSMDEPPVEQALVETLDALIVDSLIAQPDKDYILSLGNVLISRAEQLGIKSASLWEVEQARIV